MKQRTVEGGVARELLGLSESTTDPFQQAVLVGLANIELLLQRVLREETGMAGAVSSEQQALEAATAALNAEVEDLSSVDGEVAADLAKLPGLLQAIGPVSPSQVNAITAATETIKSLTSKLKGEAATAASEEAAAEAPAGTEPPAQPAAPANVEATAAGGGAPASTPAPTVEGSTPSSSEPEPPAAA